MLLSTEKKEDGYISTWKHTNPLPELLKTCSLEEFEIIVSLSSEALSTLRQSTSSLQFQEILTKKILEITNAKNSELSTIQKDYEQKLNYLNTIQTSKHSSETFSLQSKIQELQLNLEQSIKSYQLLNQNFMSLQSTSNEYFEKNLNTVLSNQKNTHESQSKMLEKVYKEQIQQLQASLEEYTKNTIQQSTPSIKGKIGELTFDNLVEQFTTWDIEDTSSTPQSCDRFGSIRGCKTLFEIKNYSHNVPKKEIDKFKRDLEVHKDCPLGIFLSLNTNIVGASEFFYTEFNSSNQLLIYIQNFHSHEPSTLFTILNTYVDIALLLHTKCSQTETTSNIQSKIDSIKPILQNELNSLALVLNELTNNKKFLLDTITKHHNSMKFHIDKLKFTFETLFKTFFDDNIMEISSEEVIVKKGTKKPRA